MNARSHEIPHAERIARASEILLAPTGLTLDQLSSVLRDIHAHDVDFADLYFQHSQYESWSLEEGIVKSGAISIDRGVGVRAVTGDKQAFAYSDDISLPALRAAGEAVRAIGRQGQSAVAPLAKRGRTHALYRPDDPVHSLQ
jgi:TldD protein